MCGLLWAHTLFLLRASAGMKDDKTDKTDKTNGADRANGTDKTNGVDKAD